MENQENKFDYEAFKQDSLNSVGELNTPEKQQRFNELVNFFSSFEKTRDQDQKLIESLKNENSQLKQYNSTMSDQLRKYASGSISGSISKSEPTKETNPIRDFVEKYFND